MPLMVGAKVDRYVVEGQLGSGGMADVYLVRHATLGSLAALKVLRIHSPQLAGRMVREGRAQARLQHPNVVAVLDLLEIDGAPGLLMERVDGPTLSQVLSQGPLPLDRVERLARGLMFGLHAAHQLGIVHRDLKPANVLVAAGDVPRIADFGLATAFAEDTDVGLTRPGTAIGTPAYMAPEQHEDAHGVDTRADVFALGVVLYELITGSAPAAGANVIAAWHKMAQKRWRPLSEVDPTLPERIDRAVRWALEPARDDRAPSVAAVWEVFFDQPFPVNAALPPRSVSAETYHDGAVQQAPTVSAIPKPARSLLGRATELALVLDPLDAGSALVTLLGTAGVGKTRIAVEVALRWRDSRRPALWADLQTARDEQDLVQTVAWALGDVTDATATATGRALGRRGPLLLVLDNVEQLPKAAAGVIAGWIRMAPSLRVLVTSRQPLGIAEERAVDVAPLAVPEREEDVLRSPAWHLLEAAAPRGALEDVDPARALRLLQALEGLPLAMELAAARLEVLGLDELEKRMADRFAVLSDPGASGERHGALYEAIRWSWSLLPDGERRALAQLSVFVAPFGLDAAEVIADPGLPVLDALHGLVRRSLVRRTGPRFSMLMSIREFAAQQLEGDERVRFWRRHAAWHGERSQFLCRGERHGSQVAEAELAERVADFGVVLERAKLDPELVDDALTCAIGRCVVFDRRGPIASVLRTADAALAFPVTTAVGLSRRNNVRSWRADALRKSGRMADAARELEALSELPLEPRQMAVVCANLADVLSHTGDEGLAGAAKLYERSLALARVHGPQHLVANTQAALGSWHQVEGRPDEADIWLARALASVTPGDLHSEREVRKTTAWVLLERDAFALAAVQLRTLIGICERLRDRRGMLYVSGQLGLVAEATGDLAEAERQYRVAAEGMAFDGDPLFQAYYDGYRARVAMRNERWAEATTLIELVLAHGGEMDNGIRSTFHVIAGIGYARQLRLLDAERHGEAAVHKPPGARGLPAALARGFGAVAGGDREAGNRHLAVCRAALDQIDDLPTRELARQVVDTLGRELGAWRISLDGIHIETPAGLVIDLGRHVANARILARLARIRIEAPGDAIDADGLAMAGWPGERIVPTAAANRVRVALSALRRAGLADLIERTEAGWRLAPSHAVRWG